MHVIETKDLSYKQGSRYLLKDICWTVQPKEHWVVLGANGCGKTTLLSTVCGYRAFNQGSVSLWGQRLTIDNVFTLRSQIGFASTSYFERCFTLESSLDIVLGARFGGFGRRDALNDSDVTRARGLLKSFGLAKRGDYPYNMLSQGQKQRVILARALMAKPKLLLLDEPLNGLDIYARDFFLNTLTEIEAKTEVTIVYVTHQAEEILPFFRKALLMKNGSVFAQGNIDVVFAADNLSNYFEIQADVFKQGDRWSIRLGEELKMDSTIWR